MPFHACARPFQTQEGDTDAERGWTAQEHDSGLLPVYDVAAAAAFDMIDPLPNGDSRVPHIYTNLRNYIPPPAVPQIWRWRNLASSRRPTWRPFDPYRIKRQASFDAQEGAISDEIADHVIQFDDRPGGNDPDPWAHVPADKVAGMARRHIDAAKQAGDKMLSGGGAGCRARAPTCTTSLPRSASF